MPLASVLDYLREHAQEFRSVADQIWETPELGLHESQSSRRLADFLESDGFSVTRGVADMPTAFVASYGTGSPVIGLLGEFDALPSLSQERGNPQHCPIVPGGPGHGCGHNLLGTGAMAAAMAVKRAIERGEVHGTVRFYGCPAEETLVGKVFMVKHGLFEDVDCALTWHPGDDNAIWATSSQAMNSAKFTFYGVAAHAAANPEDGRSALDAVELMNVGANFLREHVPSTTRIHYVITDGGLGPNVVPNRAEVWYYVRAPKRHEVEAIYARLLDIARGAAMMAGVTHEVRLLTGCYDTMANRVLGDRMQANMEAVGAPRYTAEEHELAAKLQKTYEPSSIERSLSHFRRAGVDVAMGTTIFEGIVPSHGYGEVSAGSTDVGDVSYVVPTAQVRTATAPIGTPGHSWQNVVTVGSGIGVRGMMYAAEIMATTACDLMSDPGLVEQAKEEFRRETASAPYVSPVRDVEKPPLNG